MTKTFCDKCGKESNDIRRIRCNGGINYLWLDDSSGHNVAKDLDLCVSCKDKLSELLKQWIKNDQPR